MSGHIESFHKLKEHLSQITSPRHRGVVIEEDTEIYRDLGIYGDEIVELMWWMEREFEVEPNMNPFIYAPHESFFFGIGNMIRKTLGVKPKFKSLKVRDLLAAIENKRWENK